MLTETVLIEQNRQLREKVDVLEETVRQYQERERDTAPLPAGLPRLSRQEEVMLRAFLRAPGVVSRERLYHAIYGGEGDTDEHIVDVHLTRIRRKLAPLGYRFSNHWGRGWSLQRPQAKDGVSPSINTIPSSVGESRVKRLETRAA